MEGWFTTFARWAANEAGHARAFVVAFFSVLVWVVCGLVFGFSDTYQLLINTGTTIVTFLMVFVIQNSQNRDQLAIQIRLDELVRANHDARNVFIGIDQLTAEELEALRRRDSSR